MTVLLFTTSLPTVLMSTESTAYTRNMKSATHQYSDRLARPENCAYFL